ncbi:unnamed protein product, partial [Polarella glacialis]
ETAASELGPHTFPRDWPDVYQESDALRSLLRKKGPCAAKQVSVVPDPDREQWLLAQDIQLLPLQSFANAQAIRDATDLAVVEGWAVYDILDDVTGAAFVAERYWWNATEDGTWLDFSPRPENLQQLLLVEALMPGPSREAVALTHSQNALGQQLLQLRFPKACRSGAGLVPRRASARPGAPIWAAAAGDSSNHNHHNNNHNTQPPSSSNTASNNSNSSNNQHNNHNYNHSDSNSDSSNSSNNNNNDSNNNNNSNNSNNNNHNNNSNSIILNNSNCNSTSMSNTNTSQSNHDCSGRHSNLHNIITDNFTASTAVSCDNDDINGGRTNAGDAQQPPAQRQRQQQQQQPPAVTPFLETATFSTLTPPHKMILVPKMSAASSVVAMDAEQIKACVQKVRLGDGEPIFEVLSRCEQSLELTGRLVSAGMCAALLSHLRGSAAADAARLLAALGRAAALGGGGLSRRVAETFLTGDGVQSLVDLIGSQDLAAAASAAEALGHACFRCPALQAKAFKSQAVRSLIKLLKHAPGESSFALWHLQVGQPGIAQAAFEEGAAAVLLSIIAATGTATSEEVMVNTLGALSSLVANAKGVQEALGANGAVEAVCALMASELQPLRVKEQASAALANLMSGHGENCRKAHRAAALKSFGSLLRIPGASTEHAAAALANLVASVGPKAAQSAVDDGALEALATLLESTAKPTQVFATLANLLWQLPDLSPRVAQLVSIDQLVRPLIAAASEHEP